MILNKEQCRANLLAVAEAIETWPEAYDQNVWVEGDELTSLTEVQRAVGIGHQCGTRACVAGWAVLLAPKGYLTQRGWDGSGKELLGLSEQVAEELFGSDADEEYDEAGWSMPDVLRGLADIASHPIELHDLDEAGLPYFVSNTRCDCARCR